MNAEVGAVDGVAAGNAMISGRTTARPEDVAPTWRIDPSRSSIEFSTRYIMPITGRFGHVGGTVTFDPERPERSWVEARIAAQSVSTGIAALDQHLRSPEFLDAERHPEIIFRSVAVEPAGERYRIQGELVVRGESHPVVVDARMERPPVAQDGTRQAEFHGSTQLRGLFANEQTRVEINLTAVEEAAASEVAESPVGLEAAPADDDDVTGSMLRFGSREPSPPLDERSPPLTVLGLSGSLRKNSYNRALLRAAKELAPEGTIIGTFDLGSIPPFNEDVEADGDPPVVAALKDRIAAADALLIATPEYNAGVPGVLKNALDWASRPAFLSVLAGKPVAMMAASPRRSGPARALRQLRETLVATLSFPLEQELAIARAHEKFTDGELSDPEAREALRQLLGALAEKARTAAEGRPAHTARESTAA